MMVTLRLLNRQHKEGGTIMKSLVYLVVTLFITGCSHQHLKSLNDRVEACKVGYQLAMHSEVSEMTEHVIFQIVLKRMNGYLGDTKEIERELSQLILGSKNESTRKKAELALYFLTSLDDFEIAMIRSEYYDENKMFQLLEKSFNEHAPEYTQVK